MENKIAIFKDAETILEVPVSTEEKTVWLNRQQMSVLFDRDVKTIGKHINNAMREELEGQVVVAKFATTTRHGAMEGKTQTKQTEYYNLDVIISVGYRVKSKRGVAFRKWANSILTEYIIKGYAINDQRSGSTHSRQPDLAHQAVSSTRVLHVNAKQARHGHTPWGSPWRRIKEF